MLEGINIKERITFTYSEDTDPKTEIIVKPLTSFEMMQLSSKLAKGDLSEVLFESVVEIKNPDIKDVEKIEEFLSSLKIEVVTQLIEKVTSINNLMDDEQKN